jgi:hypothetical protein
MRGRVGRGLADVPQHGHSIMKYAILAVLLSLAAAMPAVSPAHAICSSCNIQTKAPSATEPGKFDYRVSCIIDESGDEVNTVVTAATDEEAIEMTKKKGC